MIDHLDARPLLRRRYQRSDTWAMVALAVFVWIFAFAGCSTANIARALDGAEKTMKGVDIALDEGSELWAKAVDLRIESCGDKVSKEDRRTCMGIFARGDELQPLLEKAVEGYDDLAKLIEVLRELNTEMQPFLEAARGQR